MNCPQCGTNVADGTSICPKCDYILDASFLSADPPAEPSEAKPAPSTRPRPARATGGNPALRKSMPGRPGVKRPTTGGRPAAARASSGGAAPAAKNDPTVVKSLEEIEAERAARASRPPPRPAPAPARSYSDDEPSISNGTASGISMVAPEAAFADAKAFIGDLKTSDKLAFIGAAVTILVCFFPWKETATEGEILGLMSLGFAAFIANLLGMGAVFVRVNRAMPRLHPVVPWLVQLGSFCFGIVWCLVYMKLASDDRQVQALFGNETVAISKPAFGVFIALLMQIVALAGTLMGLKEKPT